MHYVSNTHFAGSIQSSIPLHTEYYVSAKHIKILILPVLV